MGKPRVVVGLDVGSTKVCALAGEVTAGGRVQLLHGAVVPAHGIQKGTIVDLDAAAAAVSRVLSQVAVATRHRIDRVLLSASAAVLSLNSRGASSPTLPDRPFVPEDVRGALAAAGDSGLPASRQVLHVIPRRFLIDGQREARNPIGLFGRRLDVDAHVVTAAGPALRTFIACVERWGAEVQAVVAQPLAAAEAVLTDDERELGVVVADVGAGSCGLTIFVDGSPWHTATIPVAGRHLTQDVAAVLGITQDAAEELKLAAGHAIPAAVPADEGRELPGGAGDRAGQISRRLLCEIIEARALELIGLVGEEIQRSGYAGLLPGGLVLSGGTARLPGIADLASELLGMRVRVGQPEIPGDTCLADFGLDGPEYSCAAGLIMWDLRAAARWWDYPARGERGVTEDPATRAGPRWRSAFGTGRSWWRALQEVLAHGQRGAR